MNKEANTNIEANGKYFEENYKIEIGFIPFFSTLDEAIENPKTSENGNKFNIIGNCNVKVIDKNNITLIDQLSCRTMININSSGTIRTSVMVNQSSKSADGTRTYINFGPSSEFQKYISALCEEHLSEKVMIKNENSIILKNTQGEDYDDFMGRHIKNDNLINITKELSGKAVKSAEKSKSIKTAKQEKSSADLMNEINNSEDESL